MKDFIYTIKPSKENFLNVKSESDDKIIEYHWNYLVKAFEKGKVKFAGRTENAEFGVCVFEAEDIQSAIEFTNNDPAVANNVFIAECYPFRIALIK